MVEVGYNMIDALERFKSDAFLQQFKQALDGELETDLVESTIAVPAKVMKMLQK
eukprot:COSAG01_NODE_2129_length_8368_cov_15.044041_11_plen_54_part_00